MAKKTTKKTTRSVPAARPESAAENGSPAVSTVASGGRSYDTEFNPDYSQTIKDLRRIGILAGTFFSILIILAFFLR